MLRLAYAAAPRLRFPGQVPPHRALRKLNQTRVSPTFSTSVPRWDASTSTEGDSPTFDIVIKNITRSTTTADLKNLFQRTSYLQPYSQLRRRNNFPYAHVAFRRREDADTAVAAFLAEKPTLNGATLSAAIALEPTGRQPKRGKVLYVRPVPPPEAEKGHTVDVNEAGFRALFGPYGKILDVTLLRPNRPRKGLHAESAKVEVCKQGVADAIVAAGADGAFPGYTVQYSHQRSASLGFAPPESTPTPHLRVTQLQLGTQERPFIGLNPLREAIVAKTGVQPLELRRQGMYHGYRVLVEFGSVEDAARVLEAMEEEEVRGELLRWDYGHAPLDEKGSSGTAFS